MCFNFFSFTVKWDLNDASKHYKLNILENLSTAFVFVIVVVNIFITAFGVQQPKSWFLQACFHVYWTAQWSRTSELVIIVYHHHRNVMQANTPFCNLSLTDSMHVSVCVVLIVDNCVVRYFFQYCSFLVLIDLFTFSFKANISESAITVQVIYRDCSPSPRKAIFVSTSVTLYRWCLFR